MWKRHWKLNRDPFLETGSPFVAASSHAEAVARLVHAIESGHLTAALRAPAGLGKSRVLTQALTEVRGPSRRCARAVSPADGTALFATLAEQLGVWVPPAVTRGAAWRALGNALRLCRCQRLQVILAIDDSQDLVEARDRLDLARLAHADPHPDAQLTVVEVARVEEVSETPPPIWELSIGLDPLTRTETERYLVAKLAAAGRDEPTFTPRSIDRIHASSAGVPRGIDRLASLALMSGALRGLEMIPPEVIEGASRECTGMTFEA